MELLQLFVTASIPVLKVLLITALGSYLALDRVDILGEVTRKNVNTIGAVYLWSYVYNIVRISSTRGIQDSNQSAEKSFTSDQASCTEPLLSSKECVTVGENRDQYALPYTAVPEEAAKATTSSKLKKHIVMVFKKINLKAIFAPSTTGAVVGFAIGVIPQIRNLLIGDGAPLRVIQDTAYLLGNGAIPALTLIIGGNLLKGLRGSGIQKSLVVGIIVVRYVALPLIGILVIKGALKFGLVHSDPLYLFVLLLQFSLPPAMNIGTMTQLFGAGENECSVIMLWTYAFASLSLTFWSAAFMWLVTRL
ncbi:hypothetical protein C1H46_031056 [Malus baccata]|uniref:Auxin efflux carrier component n=1 Tax=Malus baccata TaxID=106549 RepID=A0A540LAD9_MALBA|nr:hypothetical protein C1H46_031056 [Malus baccata]